MKKVIRGIAAVLAVIGIMSMGSVALATTSSGSKGVLADTKYSLEDMLVYAIEDEYMADAEYDAIMEKYGVQPPFSNIARSEENQIYQLEQLLKKYKVTLPNKDWSSLVTLPDSLEDCYKAGITTEENNIAMYEKFLKEDLPKDVKIVFENLAETSKRHLYAYENALEGNIICGPRIGYNGNSQYDSENGYGYGNGMRNEYGYSNGMRNEYGYGNGTRNGNGYGNGMRNGYGNGMRNGNGYSNGNEYRNGNGYNNINGASCGGMF